jgi:hypothetical protein
MPDPRYQITERLVHVPDITQLLADGWLDLDSVSCVCCVSTKSREAFIPILRVWELCVLDKILPGFNAPCGVAALPHGQLCVAECNYDCGADGLCGNAFQIVDYVHVHHQLRSRPPVRMTVGPAIKRTPQQLDVPGTLEDGSLEDTYVPETLDGAYACAFDGDAAVFATDINGTLHKFSLVDGRFFGSVLDHDDSYWRLGTPIAVTAAQGLVYVLNQSAMRGRLDTIEVTALPPALGPPSSFSQPWALVLT